MLSNVVIWQEDISLNSKEAEIIFEGSVMDIPWYIMDFYLFNSKEGEAIAAQNYGDKENPEKCGFIIYVKEGKE